MFDIGKTRVIGLPCGEEIMIKYLAVSIEYRRVTDRQTDGQNCCDKSEVEFRIAVAVSILG